jgi:putative hydrolase of the HAD superfamily
LHGKGAEIARQYRRGLVTEAEFWREIKEKWGIQAPDKELSELWASSYQPNHTTIGLLRRLRKAGYKIFFLSNNIKERVDYLEKHHHFMADFDGGVFSHEIGSVKPEPEIYKAALEKVGAEASTCLFIDNKEEYLEIAEFFGMKTLFFY